MEEKRCKRCIVVADDNNTVMANGYGKEGLLNYGVIGKELPGTLCYGVGVEGIHDFESIGIPQPLSCYVFFPARVPFTSPRSGRLFFSQATSSMQYYDTRPKEEDKKVQYQLVIEQNQVSCTSFFCSHATPSHISPVLSSRIGTESSNDEFGEGMERPTKPSELSFSSLSFPTATCHFACFLPVAYAEQFVAYFLGRPHENTSIDCNYEALPCKEKDRAKGHNNTRNMGTLRKRKKKS